MQETFVNETHIAIDAERPVVVTSDIEVDLAGTVVDIDVLVDIEHTYVGDLALMVRAPDGTQVLLAANRGGAADNYDLTIFDDEAVEAIMGAPAPSSGRYRPIQPLSAFDGTQATGTWRLSVTDSYWQDGGTLKGWAIAVQTAITGPVFDIDVRFLGGLTASQQSIFEQAAQRWEAVITEPLSQVIVGTEVLDGVQINARGTTIDGVSGVLGRAGPTWLRPDSGLPATGMMEFDTADLAALELNGQLLNVIIHEMGHVLGIGTLWSRTGLLVGAGGPDPRFVGPGARGEWDELGGVGTVPVANTGGPGSRDGHWREGVFGGELMTPFLGSGPQPLSRMSIASLEDLGYVVNRELADPYVLPSPLALAAMGMDGVDAIHCLACAERPWPEPKLLPPEALV